MKTRKRLIAIGLLLFTAYLTAYVQLSRQGYAESEALDLPGFYYFTPENSDAWRYKNYGCMYLFWPLNVVDRYIGTGRYPSSEPFWGLGNKNAQ